MGRTRVKQSGLSLLLCPLCGCSLPPLRLKARCLNKVSSSLAPDLYPYSPAPSFQDHCVPPLPFELRDSFPPAHLAESVCLVQADAGNVFGKDAGLQGPDAVLLRGFYERCHQGFAHTLAAGVVRHVDRDLSYTRVNAPPGDRTERRPSQQSLVITCDQSRMHVMARVPCVPTGRFGFEGGVMGRNTGAIDGFDSRPIRS